MKEMTICLKSDSSLHAICDLEQWRYPSAELLKRGGRRTSLTLALSHSKGGQKMDVAVDVYVAVPLLFTVLAVIIASLYLRFRPSDASAKDQATSSKVDESKAEEEPRRNAEEAKTLPDDVSEEPAEKSAEESEKTTKGKMPVEEIGAGEGNLQNQETTKNSEKEPAPAEEKSPQTSESKQEPSHPEEKLKKEEDEAEIGSTKSLPDEGTDDLVDEYRPGKIRGSNYEKTLTREELEAEQRETFTVENPQVGLDCKVRWPSSFVVH
ncbi:uncharacterized protein LOC144699743 isoform X2 [Cetorhinus maximus]